MSAPPRYFWQFIAWGLVASVGMSALIRLAVAL